MSRLRRLAGLRLTSLATDTIIAQAMCFALGPILLIIAVWGVARLATTPGEILIGILGAANLAFLTILTGLILPLTGRGRS